MSALLLRGRARLFAVMLCLALGAGGVIAVQAVASGLGARSSGHVPTVPSPVKVTPGVPLRPTSGQAAATTATTATDVHCGETLAASVVLNGDLICPANTTALLISKPSITLNLNGHTIASAAPPNTYGNGVVVSSNSDIVDNGTITGFYYGVQIDKLGEGAADPTSDTVTKIRATYNWAGILDNGSKSKVTSNITYANAHFGIFELGSSATITGNIATSNGFDGVVVDFASGILVSGNQADSNLENGILTVFSTGTTITGNTANFNTDDGIVSSDPDTIDGGGNIANGNDTRTGDTPEQCSAIACSSS